MSTTNTKQKWNQFLAWVRVQMFWVAVLFFGACAIDLFCITVLRAKVASASLTTLCIIWAVLIVTAVVTDHEGKYD